MAGENAAIWEVQASAGNGTESTATSTHTLLFNTTSRVPSDGGFVSEILVNFRRAIPENEAVNADNNELQDMGISGLDITIDGVIGNADNDTAANGVTKLQKWLKDGNGVTLFTKGNFGLRLNNAPQWNVVPTSTYGFFITDVTFRYEGERKDMCFFTIHLALGGDIPSAI